MLNIAEKFKQKLTGAKNKVKAAANKTTDEAQESVTSSTYAAKAGTNQQTRRFEEGGPGTEVGRRSSGTDIPVQRRLAYTTFKPVLSYDFWTITFRLVWSSYWDSLYWYRPGPWPSY